MDLIDLLIEQKKAAEKFFLHPEHYAQKIKMSAENIFGKGMVEVYLFGSVVSGEASPSSDIDILVIAPPVSPEERGEVLAALKKSVGMTSPFEIHLITKEQYDSWYSKFIDKKVAV